MSPLGRPNGERRRAKHEDAPISTHDRVGPKPTAPHLVVMAAGTGGHIIPGLAVAAEMQARGWTVSWIGTPRGMEHKLVPPTGIALDATAFAGLRGKGWRQALAGIGTFMLALVQCWRILRQRRATAVLGMGGYVCLPGGIVAALLRRPVLLVNADAGLLLSNRALLPFVRRIVFGFDGPAVQRCGAKAVVTGNPVRAAVEAIAAPAERFAGRAGALRLLVVGGSLGAKVLNDCVPSALALLAPAERPAVTHQTGAAHLRAVLADYGRAGLPADVRPFIDDMAAVLAACDVIVCRAGAITVSELCAAGVASVLVPFVASTTAHQRDNAEWLAAHGAAVHVAQATLTPRSLADLLRTLTRDRLQQMATKARALARPHAAARVAAEVESLVAA